NRGYTVRTAKNAETGISRIRENSPDLILMDLSLPDLDGWTATEKLKQSQSTKSIPVIAITAHATTEEREKALDAGCEDYESKPIDFDQLEKKINELSPEGD
ncbi:MAG: response regulator, partial [bacterium]